MWQDTHTQIKLYNDIAMHHITVLIINYNKRKKICLKVLSGSVLVYFSPFFKHNRNKYSPDILDIYTL